MTEDEAKTKVCPFDLGQRLPYIPYATGYTTECFQHGSYVNQMSQGNARRTSNCIGSACMAWRWNPWRDFPPGGHTSTIDEQMQKSTTDGYCGLAGKP